MPVGIMPLGIITDSSAQGFLPTACAARPFDTRGFGPRHQVHGRLWRLRRERLDERTFLLHHLEISAQLTQRFPPPEQ
ncbi:MAG: hypothetical protein Q7V57_08555 [Actinomycetota bacterium]|nr:hypothetical protein [Actinomycetota bacterium]